MSVLDEIGAYVSGAIRQSVNPVFNALGRNVGSYDTLANLAAGKIYTYPGEAVGPAAQWTIKNGWGVITNAGDYLISQNVRPSWLSDAQVKAAADRANKPLISLPEITLPGVPAWTGANPVDPLKPAANYTPLLVYGGLGLLAILLVRRL